jgi:hypothetical protein
VVAVAMGKNMNVRKLEMQLRQYGQKMEDSARRHDHIKDQCMS